MIQAAVVSHASRDESAGRMGHGDLRRSRAESSIPLQELGVDGVLEERGVAGDNGQARRGDEVAALVFNRVVANHSAFGDVDVAVDDGAADAAVAADVDV